MASIEFIQKRIEGREKEIANLEKKMERILKAQASNWENNPYYYHEDDIRRTSRDLEEAKKALEGYKAQLQTETEKANSRNITVIIEFLDAWKKRTMDFYKASFERYLEEYKEWREYRDEWNDNSWKIRRENPEEYARKNAEYRQRERAFRDKWNFVTAYVYAGEFEEARFQKVLDQEATAKYDFIVERTNAIVGTITDATNLTIGEKGDLNGFIIGERGKAKVTTIGAGGYNIQCFHFRTLIKEVA